MSVLATARPRDDQERIAAGRSAAETRPEPSYLDQLAASVRSSYDGTQLPQMDRLHDAYAPVLEALAAAERKRPSDYWTDNLFTRDWARPEDHDKIWAGIARVRARDPKAFADLGTRDQFEQRAVRRDGGTDRDEALLARGTGLFSKIVQFAGAAIGDSATPEDLALAMYSGGWSRGYGLARGMLIDGLANAGSEVLQMPQRQQAADRIGRENDPVENIAGAFAFGAAFHAAGSAVEAGKGFVSQRMIPRDLRLARALGKETLDGVSDVDIAKAFADRVPDHLRTPDEQAALHIVQRSAEVDAASPYTRTYAGIDANEARLGEAARTLVEGPSPARRAVTGAEAAATVKRRIARVENATGDPHAKNPRSSATGKYQFIDDTWLNLYRQRFGQDGSSNAQVLARRSDSRLQDVLMDDLMAYNARALARAGVPDTPGNLYLAHFAGDAGAVRLHRAGPGAMARDVLGGDAIRANPFLADMSARDVIAWADRKMGGRGEATPAGPRLDDTLVDDQIAALSVEQAGIDAQRTRLADDAADVWPDHDFEPLPELRRDLFDSDAEWKLAQAQADADALGYDRPTITRQTLWEDARDALMLARQGEVRGALFHRDIGPIDVKWGEAGTGKSDGMGLAKLAAFHPEVLENLPALLEQMEVVSRTANRIKLESPTHKASVRLDWDGQAQTWLMTAYEARGKGKAASPATEYGLAADDARTGNFSAREAGSDIGAFAEKHNPAEPRLTADTVARAWREGRMPDGFDPAAVERFAADNTRAVMDAADRQDADLRAMAEAQAAEMNDAPLARFGDPAAQAAKDQADGLAHDLKMDAESGALDGIAFATPDGRSEPVTQALARLDDEDAALKALRECL